MIARKIARLRIGLKNAHPLLFVLAPVLTVYSLNTSDLVPLDCVRPALLLLAVLLALAPLVYRLAARGVERTAWVLSLAAILFFCGQQYRFVVDGGIGGSFWLVDMATGSVPATSPLGDAREAVIITLWLVILFFAGRTLLRTRRDPTAVFWIAGVALVVPAIYRVADAQATHRSAVAEAIAMNARIAPQRKTASAPDLYVIVLDAYARQDVLHDIYGVDNEPFLSALEKRGFTVARKSRANYPHTVLALTAALNLDYLPSDVPGGNRVSLQPRIDHNRIAALLRARGFRFVSIPTGFGLTAAPSADLLLDAPKKAPPRIPPFPTPLESLLLQNTPFAFHNQPLRQGFDDHRARILAAFAHLPDAAALPYPKFVFAHILVPHPPFVFDADGKPVQPEGQSTFGLGDASNYHGTRAMYRRGYASQIGFVNRETLAALDAMRRASKRPSVIVVMGDHGARSHTDWSSLARTDVHEAFSNLFSVSLPPGDAVGAASVRARLSGTVTPITGLRAVMDVYYGAGLPDLPDRSFYSSLAKPLKFEEVTNELTAAERCETTSTTPRSIPNADRH